MLETALEVEISEHPDYNKREVAGRNGENSRNGTRPKTVLTQIGPVTIDVPRDRESTFEPVIVHKRQRRLDGGDELVRSLSARGPTTGEISAHLGEVYGASVSQDTISKITAKVIEEMNAWQHRPLDAGFERLRRVALLATAPGPVVALGAPSSLAPEVHGHINHRRARGQDQGLAHRPAPAGLVRGTR